MSRSYTMPFGTNVPDLKELINKLDLMDEAVNKEVRKAIADGAEIVANEQRRLAPYDYLRRHISASKVQTTQRNNFVVTTGYQKEAFEEDGQKKKPGVVGLVFEFGRPGKSPQGSSEKDILGRRKGAIQPQPHIRQGFDNKVEEAARTTVEAVEKIIERTLNS